MAAGADGKKIDVFSVSVLIMLSVLALLVGGIVAVAVKQARRDRARAGPR